MNNKSCVITQNETKCSFCKGKIILTPNGHTCSECGIIHRKHYTNENYYLRENEGYDNKTSKQFVAIGKQIDNVSQLGSYIDFYKTGFFFDNRNKPLSPEKQRLFYRLKFTREFRTRLDQNETYYRVVKVLKVVSNHLKLLQDVRKRAAYFYNKIIKRSEKNNEKVPNHISLIATTLFLASREYSSLAPITIHEICDTFQNFGHRVNCKMIIRDMLKFKQYIDIKTTNHKSYDYLERLTNKVLHNDEFKSRFVIKRNEGDSKDYIQQLKTIAKKIIKIIPNQTQNSRNPFILAGASIYGADVLISKKQNLKRILTQKVIANATGIAEYSIRDHYCSVIKPVLEKYLQK